MDHMRIFSCNIICNFFRVSPLTWMWYETEIHGNGCRRHLPLRVKIFNAIFSRIVSMCVCFLPLLLPFCGITKITVSTYCECVHVCVWAATKFQGQSYKIIVWRHIKAKMHGVRQILLSPLYKYCNPDNMFH